MSLTPRRQMRSAPPLTISWSHTCVLLVRALIKRRVKRQSSDPQVVPKTLCWQHVYRTGVAKPRSRTKTTTNMLLSSSVLPYVEQATQASHNVYAQRGAPYHSTWIVAYCETRNLAVTKGDGVQNLLFGGRRFEAGFSCCDERLYPISNLWCRYPAFVGSSVFSGCHAWRHLSSKYCENDF